MVLFYKDYILGEDPTDVERVMRKIRRLGAIEIALWDIAGQVDGVRPVFKGQDPQHFTEVVQQMKKAPEGFTLIKMPIAFHNPAPLNAMPGAPHGNSRALPSCLG